MTAYATGERFVPDLQLRSRGRTPELQSQPAGIDIAVLDRLLARLADLVVDSLAERTVAKEPAEQWMDAREAAEYLGLHRDTLRKLAAERAVPVHQNGPGCKLFFLRDELDCWRLSSKAGRRRLRAV